MQDIITLTNDHLTAIQNEAVNEQRGVLLYFGDSEIPYGLVYDKPIYADQLDSILSIIKERMLETIQTQVSK